MPEQFKIVRLRNEWFAILALNERLEYDRILLVHGESKAEYVLATIKMMAEVPSTNTEWWPGKEDHEERRSMIETIEDSVSFKKEFLHWIEEQRDGTVTVLPQDLIERIKGDQRALKKVLKEVNHLARY